MRAAIIATILMSWGCSGGFEESSLRDNTAPTPALRAPVIAPVGAPIELDAGASFDADADALTFVFEIAGYVSLSSQLEPIPSTDPVLLFTFPADGLYTVQLRAIDIHGAESVALQDVAARSEYPDPPDFCVTDTDCVVGDECAQGVCYANGGAVE